jgi:uncharacterized YccA/Bax inhibitor family protein
MEFKSKNPFLNNKAFAKGDTSMYKTNGHSSGIIDYNNTMTISGAINKTFILFVLLLAGASVTWYMAATGQNPMPLAITGAVIGFLLVLVAMFKPQQSQYLAPAYALFEGLFIGGISVFFESMYPGTVIKAVGGTFVTFGVCLALYRFGVVKVTEQFKSVVIASTLAIGTFYLLSFVLSFFGVTMFIQGSSLISIGFSIFVIVIAALNLFMDFDMIEQGARQRNPKFMEWFGAMGLVITMVWLYLEFLRLLSKLSRN